MRGTMLLITTVTGLSASTALAHVGHDAPPADDRVVFVFALAEPVNEVKIEVRGEYRHISSNGIPDHETGRFPNRGNPNAISAQPYQFRMPVKPKVADKPSSALGMPFGIAVNGLVFDPGTAEIWTKDGRRMRQGPPTDNEWCYDALSGKINLGIDTSNAHVQPTGAYHYHGIPVGLVEKLTKGVEKPKMVLVGYAADGFPIYSELAYEKADDAASTLRKMKSSYRVKQGQRPGGDQNPDGKYDGTYVQDFEYVEGLGDLDECNGRTGVTPEYPDGTYYYVLTDSYPFVPRLFKGTPDKSFERRRGERPPPRREDGPPPRDR